MGKTRPSSLMGRTVLILNILFVVACVAEREETFCRCERFPIEKKPFVALWNAPTGGCAKNFSVDIQLDNFEILANLNQTWNGKYVVVFYNAQLGYYPYFTNPDGTRSYNGGMPQLVDINAHLAKARKDIVGRIPDPNFNGLAVIDWEGWRPVWDRNWGSKKIYQTKSIEILRSQHPDWSMEQLVGQAKNRFEQTSKRMMSETLRLGKYIRPKANWGFYGFPDCYGNEKTSFMCSEEHKRSNNKLHWMFHESTALFPSIYLPENAATNGDFVKGRLMETLRLAQKHHARDGIPVFPYFRLIYERNPLDYDFLTDEDLENTIGQAAELGAAGVVMWGNRRDENTSPDVCRSLNNYIHSKLGPYFKSVELNSEKCSEIKCNGNGRCIKKTLANNLNIYLDDMGRNTCPGKPKHFTVKKRKTILKTQSFKIDKNTEAQENAELNVAASHVVKTAKNDERTPVNAKGREGIKMNHKGNEKHKSGDPGDHFIATDNHHDTLPDFEENDETSSKSNDKNSSHSYNTTSQRSETPSNRDEVSSDTIFCNKTESGTTKCMLVKRHNSMKLSKHNGFQIPQIYAVLISISLGGALVLSTIYIGTYYYFNIFKKKTQL